MGRVYWASWQDEHPEKVFQLFCGQVTEEDAGGKKAREAQVSRADKQVSYGSASRSLDLSLSLFSRPLGRELMTPRCFPLVLAAGKARKPPVRHGALQNQQQTGGDDKDKANDEEGKVRKGAEEVSL